MCCDLAGFFSQTPRRAGLDDFLVAAECTAQANSPPLAAVTSLTNFVQKVTKMLLLGSLLRGIVIDMMTIGFLASEQEKYDYEN